VTFFFWSGNLFVIFHILVAQQCVLNSSGFSFLRLVNVNIAKTLNQLVCLTACAEAIICVEVNCQGWWIAVHRQTSRGCHIIRPENKITASE
jgi:hypothetical protein